MFNNPKSFVFFLIIFSPFFLCVHLYAGSTRIETDEPIFTRIRRIGYTQEIRKELERERPFFVLTDPLPSEKKLARYGAFNSAVLLGTKDVYRCSIYTNQTLTTMVYSKDLDLRKQVKDKHPNFIKRIWDWWQNRHKANYQLVALSYPTLYLQRDRPLRTNVQIPKTLMFTLSSALKT